jgi:hypothetical protein
MAALSLNNFFLMKVPHVILLLVWTHKKGDVSLKIDIISTVMKQSCPLSTVCEHVKETAGQSGEFF